MLHTQYNLSTISAIVFLNIVWCVDYEYNSYKYVKNSLGGGREPPRIIIFIKNICILKTKKGINNKHFKPLLYMD